MLMINTLCGSLLNGTDYFLSLYIQDLLMEQPKTLLFGLELLGSGEYLAPPQSSSLSILPLKKLLRSVLRHSEALNNITDKYKNTAITESSNIQYPKAIL